MPNRSNFIDMVLKIYAKACLFSGEMKLRGIKKPPNFYRLLNSGKLWDLTNTTAKTTSAKKKSTKNKSCKNKSAKIKLAHKKSAKSNPAGSTPGRILKETRNKVTVLLHSVFSRSLMSRHSNSI